MLTPHFPSPKLIAVDLVPLYPQSLTPTFVFALRDYYIATYSDRFFSPQAPAWFRVYIWMEALYHIPLSIWALKGLWQGTLHLYELCDWLKNNHKSLFVGLNFKIHLSYLDSFMLFFSIQNWRPVFSLFTLIIRPHSLSLLLLFIFSRSSFQQDDRIPHFPNFLS